MAFETNQNENEFKYENNFYDKTKKDDFILIDGEEIKKNDLDKIADRLLKKCNWKPDIKQLKRKLEKEIKRYFLRKKTLKVKKSFCKMRARDFYDKYILKDLSVKKAFAGFSKENRRIFRKLSKKITSPGFKLLLSTKISTFF